MSICLNMIVKDEAAVIRATLENICSKMNFAYWVISDTGSSDDTIQIIRKFFNERNIDGELLQHRWVNFGHNRTLALEAAFNKTDYVFIFDADDRIHGTPNIPSPFDADVYNFQFGKEFTYFRPLLVNNRIKSRFVGVLHEYLETSKNSKNINGDYFIESGRTGNRSANPTKYYDDAIVLQNEFLVECDAGLKSRYAFYCAQSYKDADMNDEAIRWYERCLKLDGWSQEKYCASLRLGDLHSDKYEKLRYWLLACYHDKERMEGVVNAMEMLYNDGSHVLVNSLYHKYRSYYCPQDKLFLDLTKYDLKMEYYNSISAYYADDKESGLACCKRLLGATQEKVYNENATNNLKFYCSDKQIFCLFLGYASIDAIVYGSELAARNLAEMLAINDDRIVIVLSDQPTTTRVQNNVVYMNARKFAGFGMTVDVMIVSRYIYYFLEYPKQLCKQLYIWLHDCLLNLSYNFTILENNGAEVLRDNYHKINGIVTLCEWHKQHFADSYTISDDKLYVIGNGIPNKVFASSPKIKHRFIYTSCFSRGIQTLVRIFHRIRERFPDAELHVYREIVPKYADFVRDCGQYDYIHFHGFVDNDKLQSEFARSDVWLYPTTFNETYCISALEAQRHSCLVICSNVAALQTTVCDRGVILESLDDDYVVDAVANILVDPGKMQLLRERGRQWAQQQTWDDIVCKWNDLFADRTNTKIINYVDHIVWINLDRCDARRKHMERMLSKTDCPNTRISAIDGEAEDLRMYKTSLTPCEVACTLSHLKAIRSLRDTAGDYFLVLEDDMTDDNMKYFAIDLATIIKRAPPFDILQIHKFWTHELADEYTDWNEFKLRSHIGSAGAYVITKQAVAQICAMNIETMYVADIYFYQSCRTYTYKYDVFTPMSIDSTIHPHHVSFHLQMQEVQTQVLVRDAPIMTTRDTGRRLL